MSYLSPLRTITQGQTRLENVTFSGVADNPVELDEVLRWLNAESIDDDLTIKELLDDVLEEFENFLNVSLRSKTVTATYTEYGREVTLPYGPVSSLTTVKSISKGTKETIDSDTYFLTGDTLVFDSLTSSQEAYYKEGLEVVYTAGFSSLPGGLKTAIKMATLTTYEDRQDHISSAVRIPENSRKKAMRYKRYAI